MRRGGELGDGEVGEVGSWRGNSTRGGDGEQNVEAMHGDGESWQRVRRGEENGGGFGSGRWRMV